MSISTDALIHELEEHLFLLLPLIHQGKIIHHRFMSHQSHTPQLSNFCRCVIHNFFQSPNQFSISIYSILLLLYSQQNLLILLFYVVYIIDDCATLLGQIFSNCLSSKVL